LKRILEQQAGTRYTSSVGRLFDAVGSLCGLVAEKSFEGRAGMLLETHFSDSTAAPYTLSLSEAATRANPTVVPRFLLDPSPMIAEIVADVRSARGPEIIASRFHTTLVAAVVEVATRVNASTVALSGGCFQNRRLTELCIGALQSRKIAVLVHRQVPANDGGISLGQAAIARARLAAGPG
jgi:hydrogenase maturation protein HypF